MPHEIWAEGERVRENEWTKEFWFELSEEKRGGIEDLHEENAFCVDVPETRTLSKDCSYRDRLHEVDMFKEYAFASLV